MARINSMDKLIQTVAPELTKPAITKYEAEWLKMREIRKKKTAKTQKFDSCVSSLLSSSDGIHHLSFALGLDADAVIAWKKEQKLKMDISEKNPKKHPLYIAFIKKFYDMSKLD